MRNNATYLTERADTHLCCDLGYCFDERSHGIHSILRSLVRCPLVRLCFCLFISIFFFQFLFLSFQVRNRKRAARRTTVLSLKPQKATVLLSIREYIYVYNVCLLYLLVLANYIRIFKYMKKRRNDIKLNFETEKKFRNIEKVLL